MEDTQKKLTLEEREVVLAKVEALMVRGVQRASEVAQQVTNVVCLLQTATYGQLGHAGKLQGTRISHE